MESSRCPRAAKPHRIVVTGLGVVSPCGVGVESFADWLDSPTADRSAAADAGRCGNGIRDFRGTIEDFGELPTATRRALAKSLKLMNRETQLGVAAGLQALRDSRLAGACDPDRIGVSYGAGNVCVAPEDFRDGVAACVDGDGSLDLAAWGPRGLDEMAPLWLLRCLPNMPACHLAILADLRGPSNTLTQRSLGFDLALAEACRVLRSGDADAILVGGTGTTVSGLNRLHVIWSHGEERLPSDLDAREYDDLAFPSEGAAAVVLERLDVARRRGATIYGEVLAAVSTSRGQPPSARASSDLWSVAGRLALRRAGLGWDNIGQIHVPGPWDGRSAPAEARRIPVICGRPWWGDCGAGSGAIETVACLLALHADRVFNTGPTAADRPFTGTPRESLAGQTSRTVSLKFNRYRDQQASCVALARVTA